MQADVNVPLTADGRWRSRYVAAYEQRDRHLDRYNEVKSMGMAVIEGDLTDTTTLTLGHQMQDNEPNGSTWSQIPLFYTDGSFARLPRSTSFADVPPLSVAV